MSRVSRRRAQLALQERIVAHLTAHPGELTSQMFSALFPFPRGSQLDAWDLAAALQRLRNDGHIRYVSRTSVPFDPVATHCGWWLVPLRETRGELAP